MHLIKNAIQLSIRCIEHLLAHFKVHVVRDIDQFWLVISKQWMRFDACRFRIYRGSWAVKHKNFEAEP